MIYTVVLILPFINLYLPILKQSGGYTYTNLVLYMPEVVDLINVGKDNLLLGNIIVRMKLSERLLYEQDMGFSIILIMIFLSFFIYIFYICKKKDFIKNSVILFSFTLAIIVSILITIKISSNGVSLWYLIYKFFPGASSVRVPIRYFLYLTFPMAIATSVMGNYIFLDVENKKKKKYLFLLLFILLWISNIRKDGINSTWNRTEEKKYLSKIKSPPKECKVFYIIDSEKKGLPEYIYQNSAFEIANYFKIKTINGNSSQFPPNWFGMYNPLSDTYADTVFNWIREHHLENVCSYDQATNQWKESNSILGLQFYINGARWENNAVRIPPNGILYGPYISLPAGKYKIEFINEFEREAVGEFGITTTKNGEVHPITTILSKDNIVSIEFELKEETHKIEFITYNKSGGTFFVKDLRIQFL